jgi:hypothetical protein
MGRADGHDRRASRHLFCTTARGGGATLGIGNGRCVAGQLLRPTPRAIVVAPTTGIGRPSPTLRIAHLPLRRTIA